MTGRGAGSDGRRRRIAAFWAERRSRWTLPLVIIVVIIIVALVDHVGAHRIQLVEQQTTSDLTAVDGGTAAVSIQQPWQGFNPGTPAGATSSTPTLLAPVLPSAFIVAPSFKTELNTDLLESVEVTATSPLTIRYDLNPRAVWSDGVPVSAADFIYAWQAQRGSGVDVNGQPDQVASTLGYRDISSVTGSNGGKTVTVVFSTPFTDWRLLFDEMVPAHIAQRYGWNAGFDAFSPDRELSAGPMELHAVSATTAVLVRNPRWWGARSSLGQVTVTFTPDATTWVHTMAHGNRAVAQPRSFDLSLIDAVSSLPNSESSLTPSPTFLQLEFDVTSQTTGRLAVRQAIAHAVDRTSLLSTTFGAVDPGLAVDDDHLVAPSEPRYAPSSAASPYDKPDLAASGRLLQASGFHKDPAGRYVDALGHPLTVRMAVELGDPWIEGVAATLSSQLQEAGISVEQVPVNGPAGLAAAARTGGYDMALVTRTTGPFTTTTAGWYSTTLGTTGADATQDWSNFDDPVVNQLFTEASRALNPDTGATYYAQIDDALWSQMVALPLFGEPAFVATGVQIQNVSYNGAGDGILWNVREWTALAPRHSARKG